MNLKNLNVNVIFISVIVILCFASYKIWDAEKYKGARQVVVRGECLKSVAKDRTAVTVEVKNLEKNASIANKKSMETYGKITNYIVELKKNFPDTDLETLAVESYERREWSESAKKNVLLGIESVIRLEITTPDKELVEKILAEISKYSDVYTNNLRMFTSKKLMKQEQEDCIAEATKNAKEKAKALAKAGGSKVGKLLNASFSQTAGVSSSGYVNTMMEFAVAEDYEAAPRAKSFAAPALFTKDSEISVSVNATFELK